MPSGPGSSPCCLTGLIAEEEDGVDHRQVVNAIFWKYRTGSPWIDLPAEFGSWKGAYSRLWKWAIDGTWERVFTALLAQADADEGLSWVVSVDSTVVRAHQHASGAGKKCLGPRSVAWSGVSRRWARSLQRLAGLGGFFGSCSGAGEAVGSRLTCRRRASVLCRLGSADAPVHGDRSGVGDRA